MKIAYNPTEAATAVGVSEMRIRRAIRGGQIAVHYAGRCQLITHADLTAWVESLPMTKGEDE